MILAMLLPSVAGLTHSPCGCAVYAQDINQQYALAQSEYSNGHFDKCEEIAQELVLQTKGMMRSSCYRLLTLCRLQKGDASGAEEYAEALLQYDPYFAPSMGDPQRFIDIINSSRQVGLTITTASRRAETIEESPVPVTVITEEMIRISGALTLRDLLCMYVPTMTRVEGMESNICMRGVVGNTQEDILVMMDGHRLNSGATNAEPLDFRNSLAKIKQIEVLRGPASSLYGNVALMAVVNIITKKGNELGGADISARYGSFQTWAGDAIYGNGNLHGDILAWGSVYGSKGQSVMQDGTRHYIDGYRNMPSFDAGIKARWGDVQLTMSHQYSKPVPYYNLVTLAPYTYDDYAKVDGQGPGSSRSSTNIFIDYNHTWDRWSISASIYGARENSSLLNALGDRLPQEMLPVLFNQAPDEVEPGVPLSNALRRAWMQLAWENYSGGVNVNASWDYTWGTQRGTLLFGAQTEVFSMTSSKLAMGYNIDEFMPIEYATGDIVDMENEMVQLHSENSVSGYMQLKNYITNRLILNGGVRFDSKHRYDRTINMLSPRIALMWIPTKSTNFKLSYAKSFVDAPYLYRANNLKTYRGVQLEPQTNHAFQLTGSKSWDRLHLKAELNLYYNRVRNLCIFSYKGLRNDPGSSGSAFGTADVDICGAEAIVEYKTEKTFVHMNMSYKYPVKMKGYSSYEHKIGNEPAFMLNLVANQRIYFSDKVGKVSLHGNLHFQTAAEMEVNYMVGDVEITNDHCNAQAMFNMGADWMYKRINLALDTYNTFNVNYCVGAQLQSWIPAQGFKVIGKIGVRL